MTTIHPEVPYDEARDELVTEILARRRRRTPLLTLTLVVLVAAAGAFAGGVEAQKHWGKTSPAASGRNAFAAAAARLAAGRAGAAQRFGGRFGGGFGSFAGGGLGAGAGATVGTVTLIKGSTLYVTDASGNTVLVHTSPASTVTKTITGSVRSILPGQTVTVLGTQSKNGSMTARSIVIGRASSG